MSSSAPRGERLVITITGRRNAGKSSLINALVGQQVAIVSEHAGTTTDPVAKQYELIPVGPVTLYDTAGLDDVGELGQLRIKATQKVLWRSDMALFVTESTDFTEEDLNILAMIERTKIPCVVVFNKTDSHKPTSKALALCSERQLPCIAVSSLTGDGITALKELIIKNTPKYFTDESVIIGDLIKGGDVVMLVVPIDLAAPKGRLILPQVQVIRECLDNDAIALTVKDREIEEAFASLTKPPALVIADSQVILKVAGDVPDDVPLTTFSTAFARYKGDLDVLVEGARKIDSLKNGDRVLIAEACSHHVQCDDIGRVKIPRWLLQYTGKDIQFDTVSGQDFPDNVSQYALVLHCGGCMITGMDFKRRIHQCIIEGIPVSNYGVVISKMHGVLERIIKPFYKE